MRLHGLTSVLAISLAVIASQSVVLAAAGIEGRLTRPDGHPVAGVTVVAREASATTISDANGRYVFEGLAPGTYTVAFSLADNTLVKDGVYVGQDASSRLDL